MRNRILVALGLLISGVFLFLAFRGLQPEAFLNTLQGVNIGIVLVSAVVYFGAVVLISWRWQFFINAIQHVPLLSLMQKVAIGYMGNNVYPLRAGEALRIYLLQRNHGVPVVRATTTVVVERIFDGIVMLTFVLVGLWFAQLENDLIRATLTVALPLFGLGLAGFFFVAFFPHITRGIVAWVARRLPTALGELLTRLSEEVLMGLGALQNPLQLLGVTFASYACWMVEAFVYWMVMSAFGLSLGYPIALLVVGIVNLAGLIPSSPGQFGVYEYFVSTVLVAVGVEQQLALSYAIVVHLTIWLPVTVVGFACLAYLGLGLNTLATVKEQT